MASVAWTKFHSVGEVKGVLRHDCKDSRQNAATHSNEDIQRDLTKLNTGILDGYDKTCKAYDDRLAALPSPKRKDAVVGLGFSIAMPDGLPTEKEDEWAEKVYKLMVDEYGQDNLVCFVMHRDEMHEYLDPDSKEMRLSRPHIQGVLVPEVDGRLCAKEVTTRSRMQKINQVVNEMTQKDYGLDFMDGSKAKSRGSVETLKQRSARAKLELKNEELEKKNQVLEEQTEGFPFKVVWSKAEKRRDKAEEDAKAAEARQKAAEDAAAKAIEKQAEAEKAAQEAAQKAQEAREAEEKARDALTDLKAQAGDIRRSVSDAVTDAEKVREYMDKVSRTPVRASDAAIIKYLKANKDGAGKSLYEIFQERATEAQRRTAGKHSAKVDSVVKSARKRALPDISQIQQPQSDDEFSL